MQRLAGGGGREWDKWLQVMEKRRRRIGAYCWSRTSGYSRALTIINSAGVHHLSPAWIGCKGNRPSVCTQ
jgi:hypothetical protein